MDGGHGGGFSLRPPVPLPRAQIKVLLLVSFAFLIAGYDITLLGLVAPKVIDEFGLPAGREGEIIMWARFGVLLALPLATLADRFGRKVLLMTTILGSAVTTLASAFAQSEPQFIVLQALVRTFGYAQDMVSIVVIAEEIEDRARGWALGILAAMAALGGGLASIIFAAVDVLPYGWRALYVIGAVPIFAIAWFWRTMPETRRFAESQAAAKPAAAENKIAAALANFAILATTHGRRFWPLMGVTAPLAFGLTSATVLLPTFLQTDLGLAPIWVTAIYVGGGIFGIFGNFIAGKIADTRGRKPVFIFAAIAFTAGMLALYLGPHWFGLLIVLWGIGAFCFFGLEVVMGAWSAELFPTAQRSTASGMRLAINILAGGVALAVQSGLYGPMGGHAPSISVLLPAVLVAAVVAALFIPETAGKTLEEITGEGRAKAHA